jgi:hypothetical protein
LFDPVHDRRYFNCTQAGSIIVWMRNLLGMSDDVKGLRQSVCFDFGLVLRAPRSGWKNSDLVVPMIAGRKVGPSSDMQRYEGYAGTAGAEPHA